jgi:membrane protease subunit HflK
MAWNEPGNSGDKDKDPWGSQGGGKGGNDGPPDLEDVVKNLQDKVTSIFGGRKGGGGGGGRGRAGGGMSS